MVFHTRGLSSAVFAEGAVAPEVKAFAERAATMMSGRPGLWDIGAEAARQNGFMPAGPTSPLAFEREMAGVKVRVLPVAAPAAVYLHFHGGGMVLGSAAGQDGGLERISQALKVTCVSVDYRLAPEHPYPAAWDDAERVAHHLARHGAEEFGSDKLLIGGESAGALLAAAAMVRMRDRHDCRSILGAQLSYGVYDSSMTPSQVASKSLILSADDIRGCAAAYAGSTPLRHPELSPLYADLNDLPPALFTVGSRDPFLDDNLFMYGRWLAAGNVAEIAIWPGADHAFTDMPHPLAAPAFADIDAFLKRCLDGG